MGARDDQARRLAQSFRHRQAQSKARHFGHAQPGEFGTFLQAHWTCHGVGEELDEVAVAGKSAIDGDGPVTSATQRFDQFGSAICYAFEAKSSYEPARPIEIAQSTAAAAV